MHLAAALGERHASLYYCEALNIENTFYAPGSGSVCSPMLALLRIAAVLFWV